MTPKQLIDEASKSGELSKPTRCLTPMLWELENEDAREASDHPPTNSVEQNKESK